MRNDAIKIRFQTGRSYSGVKHEQICAVLNSKPPAQFQLWAPAPSQHQTPGQQLHKGGYLTGKGVTATCHWSSCWDYQTPRGSWSVQYLPWIISPSPLFWQYKRKASSSSIWDEMVQGSPTKKSNTGKFTTKELSGEFQLVKNVPASNIASSLNHLILSWHFDQSQNGTT